MTKIEKQHLLKLIACLNLSLIKKLKVYVLYVYNNGNKKINLQFYHVLINFMGVVLMIGSSKRTNVHVAIQQYFNESIIKNDVKIDFKISNNHCLYNCARLISIVSQSFIIFHLPSIIK